jgi:hypothetical protein
MHTNNDPDQAPPNRKLAAGLGLLTALVLLGAAGTLAVDLVSLIGTDPAAAPVAPAIANAPAGVEMPWLTFPGNAMLAVASIVALVIIAPLIGALCLFGLLHRYGQHLGPLIHLQYTYTVPPPMAAGPFATSSLGVAGAAACSAQPLNLGLSFEEERLRKTAQTGRMEAGVLAQLFDDNVKLQEKIGLARAKEKATAAAANAPFVVSSVNA